MTVTALIVFSFMGLMNWRIDLITSALFVMLMIGTIQDFIFVSYARSAHPERPWRRSFRRLLIPSFFTSLTTVIGFGSLALSDIEMIKHFGILTALGAAVEWIVLFTALPATIALLPSLGNWTMDNAVNRWQSLARIANWRPSKPLTAAAALLGLFGFVALPALNIADSPLSVFPDTHVMKKAHYDLLKSRGWIVDANLLYSDQTDDFHRQTLSWVKKDPIVAQVDDLLEARDWLSRGQSPESQKAIAEDLKFSPSFARYSPDDEHLRSILLLKEESIQAINGLRSRIDEYCRGRCQLAGSLVSYSEFGERIPRSLLASLFTSLVLVALVLWRLARFRKERFLPLLISFAWGPLVLFVVLWLVQIQIYFVTTIFASVVVGLAGDNAIQFLFAGRKGRLQEGLRARSVPSLMVSLSLCTMPLLFMLSPFVPLKTLGLVFCLGMFICFFGDVTLLSGLLGFSQPARPDAPRFQRPFRSRRSDPHPEPTSQPRPPELR